MSRPRKCAGYYSRLNSCSSAELYRGLSVKRLQSKRRDPAVFDVDRLLDKRLNKVTFVAADIEPTASVWLFSVCLRRLCRGTLNGAISLCFAKATRSVEYLVKWRGYRLDESTWEPEENVSEALIR